MSSIRVRGASEHNLKEVSLDIPRDRLTVVTGISGSGKSSLAFDTIYREGRRRFLESLPAYARRFLGGFEKPRVESIEGLSPAVSIDQKTVGHSERSTVGTLTEIYDHLRLLFARLGRPHCPRCGRPVGSQSPQQVADQVLQDFAGRTVLLCAPVVRERRGQFRRELAALRRDGYQRLRVDGRLVHLAREEPAMEPHRVHTLEVVYDRVRVEPAVRSRLVEGVEKCFDLAEGCLNVVGLEEEGPGEEVTGERLFSGRLACPECGVDLPDLEPRLFSFNTPRGACPRCAGHGTAEAVDPELLVADPNQPLRRGGLVPFTGRSRAVRSLWDLKGLQALARRQGFSLGASWNELTPQARAALLEGDGNYPGLLERARALAAHDAALHRRLLREVPCPDCGGSRLSAAARAVTFSGWTLPELCSLELGELLERLETVELRGGARLVGEPILTEIRARLGFLVQVGLSYLALNRSAPSLAGGEAQRIRLASQVGSGLRGMLFVLDEPSIGLHPRDHARLLATLGRLRDLGNTVLVVEHDRDTALAADHIVDLGPGAGPQGGEVVAQGPVAAVAAEPLSLTGDYLAGRRAIPVPAARRPPGDRWLQVTGAAHHNLKEIDVSIPLGCFVSITGVSGSGKSSLVGGVLRPGLLRKLGRAGPDPGRHRALSGWEHIDKVLEIDQSPIGKTPRSNPATYSKVFGPIRDLFARIPEARARGYRPGRFSFNVHGGRCPECGGAGVTVVDMQFLAPVETTCDACGGRRYTRETLEIRYRGRSIHDVLEMAVSEALELFRDHPPIRHTLEVLAGVGLGYLRLGQPSTTLSGGEAQRLKLVSELRKRDTGRTVYFLDEPTTGLHFEDIRLLLRALDELVERGNTVVVIEHNLEVIKCADYVIDLGPEGGDGGGEVVATGSPEEVSQVAGSHTGRFLRPLLEPPRRQRPGRRGKAPPPAGNGTGGPLVVRGARTNNLQAIDVEIPRRSLTVITGVSGSGKTSLAFDTIFAEGQRRYVESLSTYARQFLGRFRRAEVDAISGLAPAIAIDQKTASANPRSTVATITEIHDYLRLLFARVGRPHCPSCGLALQATTPTRLAAEVLERFDGEKLYVLAPVILGPPDGGSLAGELAAFLKAGFTRILVDGEEIRLDEEATEPARAASAALKAAAGSDPLVRGPYLVVDRVVPRPEIRTRLADSFEQAFEQGGGVAALAIPCGDPEVRTAYPACPRGHFKFPGRLEPRMFSFNSAQGACPRCRGLGVESRLDLSLAFPRPERPFFQAMDPLLLDFLARLRTSAVEILKAVLRSRLGSVEVSFRDVPEDVLQVVLWGTEDRRVTVEFAGLRHQTRWAGLAAQLEAWMAERDEALARCGLGRLFSLQTCSGCEGQRLRPEILAVRIGGLNLPAALGLTITQARGFFASLDLEGREAVVAREVLKEIGNRLRFLEDVGLGYLSLDRPAGTLSGGEAQRIRLASQLGNRLVDVLYVLDEPTVGLHQRDIRRLLGSLKELRDQGNTIIVVEHDREVIEQADRIVDIGPGPGTRGGRVVAAGTAVEVSRVEASLTGRYLRGALRAPGSRNRLVREEWLELGGVCCHNVRDLDVAIPLGVMTCVAGVSGSGKSTLVMDVLAPAVEAHLAREPLGPEVRRLAGVEALRRLVVVDQRPLGRTSRSTPATYTGLWDEVRELYATLPLARQRGYTPSRFSFNAATGACFSCQGQGAHLVEMVFLSDVWVECDACRGRRFDDSTLEVRFKGKNVSEILAMEIDEAADFFANQPRIRAMLETLQGVGLGYLKLGQPATTLSGGEAQRLKLASELVAESEGGTLYVLDEPTTGLHFDDVSRLVEVLQALVERGNTVVVIEHQLDVVAAADWVIDLGPEGGDEGGRVVAQGTPEQVALSEASITGQHLRRRLAPAALPARGGGT